MRSSQILLLCSAVFLMGFGSFALAEERPNILFCLADDWGWPHAGAYGDPVVQTPNFDRLAKEGVLFENAFVSSPSCTPSRNALLTGRHFYQLGEGANLWSVLDANEPNFMFLLRAAGYAIGHHQKAWGPGNFRAGGYTEHPCGPEMEFSKFIEKRDGTAPFCFWLGTSDPHRGYKKGSGRKSGMDLSKIPVPKFFPDTEEIRSDIADYYFEVQRWDRKVGEAIKLLEASGQLENTIIVMTGDHGMPFPRCKGNLYDSGTRVPLAIRWGKEVSGGRVIKDCVSFIDLAPTFLASAEVAIPKVMTGESFLGSLKGNKAGWIEPERRSIVYGRERHTPSQASPSIEGYPSRALRQSDWLLIMNLKPDRWPAGVPEGASHPMDHFSDCDNSPSKSEIIALKDDPEGDQFYQWCFAKRPEFELYHTAIDPDQIQNLAGETQHQERLNQMVEELKDYLVRTGDPRLSKGPTPFDKTPYRGPTRR